MTRPGIVCVACGQDHLTAYRSVLDGLQFLLCPECDSVWLATDDPTRRTPHSLSTVFAGHTFLPGQVDWDFIEPVGP